MQRPCKDGRLLDLRDMQSAVLISAFAALFLSAPLSATKAQDVEWSELRAFIEINATDGDAGL